MKRILLASLLVGFFGSACAQLAPEQTGGTLKPASRVEQMAHHRAIPADDIWWTVRGEQMAWMHRHIQEMFPTVPVYRAGQVRPLKRRPLASIAEYPVTLDGKTLPFSEFLQTDYATALGVVILHKGDIVFEQYPRMRAYEKPIYWSATKVFAGAMIRLLEEKGRIDV